MHSCDSVCPENGLACRWWADHPLDKYPHQRERNDQVFQWWDDEKVVVFARCSESLRSSQDRCIWPEGYGETSPFVTYWRPHVHNNGKGSCWVWKDESEDSEDIMQILVNLPEIRTRP